MYKILIYFTIIVLSVRFSLGQKFRADPREQVEKEDPTDMFSDKETTTLDFLEALEILGIGINKFDLGKFDKSYDIFLIGDTYYHGNLIKKDTLGQFGSTYRYYESNTSETPYFDYLDKIKIITKDSENKSEIYIRTYNFGSKMKLELKRDHENSFFNWRRYTQTAWQLNKDIPLLVFASSWTDKEYGFDRFCGVAHLTDNGEETNELLTLSPSYIKIYYTVKEK